ncbi:hypothetical protein [Actinacidiphila yeochonensis]|uniref:hypothetical protein n=1 Tax=Actinacidiphila yeochonensis TaxID=89050 RepID=UPI0006898D36|nr:hypothetical protein [Actinacidiphila yeochonensis]
MDNGHDDAPNSPGTPDGRDAEAVLHRARARVLADLTARGAAGPEAVSMLEEAVSSRRWWLEQWADGAEFVPGLVAQDVQDALLEVFGRWPLCPLCDDPHALAVEPELGPDPHWVCEARGVGIAPVGSLGAGPDEPRGPQEPREPR